MQKSGAELKQAREHAGLLAEQIADRTKIKLHKIIALEEGDFDSLPQGIYLDGIVRAYAREVKIDAEPIVELVRLERGKLPGDTPIPFQEPVEFERPLPANEIPVAHTVAARATPQRGRLAFALVVLLAIAGWGAYLYEVTRASDRDTTGKISTPAPQPRPQNTPVAFSENSVSTYTPRSEDVSGAWRLATHIESSSYARFEGLQLGYQMKLEQNGDRVTGEGRKVAENGGAIGPHAQTPVSVAGIIDGDRLTLDFIERGAQRPTQGKFDLLLDEPGKLRGRFTSTAARSSGTVVAQRLQ